MMLTPVQSATIAVPHRDEEFGCQLVLQNLSEQTTKRAGHHDARRFLQIAGVADKLGQPRAYL